MIVDERMVTYIRSLERPENPVIEAIEQEALESFVPIIRKETQSFLKVMMLMNRPARVLEVGTAVGFSAILMSEYLPEGSRITTIENYEKRIPIARNNFKRAGKEEQITLIEGDALEVMKTLEGPYDFIFMDAAKGQYIHYMPEAVRLLAGISNSGCLFLILSILLLLFFLLDTECHTIAQRDDRCLQHIAVL